MLAACYVSVGVGTAVGEAPGAEATPTAVARKGAAAVEVQKGSPARVGSGCSGATQTAPSKRGEKSYLQRGQASVSSSCTRWTPACTCEEGMDTDQALVQKGRRANNTHLALFLVHLLQPGQLAPHFLWATTTQDKQQKGEMNNRLE